MLIEDTNMNGHVDERRAHYYETRPVEHFMPRMRAIFGRQPWGPYARELWPVA